MHRMFLRDFMCDGIPVESQLFRFALRAYVRHKFFPLVGRKIDLFDEKNGLKKLMEAVDGAARKLYSFTPGREAA